MFTRLIVTHSHNNGVMDFEEIPLEDNLLYSWIKTHIGYFLLLAAYLW